MWAINKKYPALNWWENFMSGHWSIGKMTIYGENAMCWAVNIRTKKWGVICFSLPSLSRKRRGWDHYFYLSPNATPWACTFHFGGDKQESIRAKIRKMNFGHNFSTKEKSRELRTLNDKFESLHITEYDMNKLGY